ncbi:MAG: DUF5667 domain-containing protein, partial [Thermocrispum sp.]
MNEPVWFRQNRDASDRFAALLEHAGDGRADDPAAAEFGDELAVVGMLRDLGAEATLTDSTRDRMRAAVLSEA